MPTGISRRPETAVEEAVEEYERTRKKSIRYQWSYFDDDGLFIEVGIPGRGPEPIVDHATAIADGLIPSVTDGRNLHLALVLADDRLGRVTIDESHGEMSTSETRARVAQAVRID